MITSLEKELVKLREKSENAEDRCDLLLSRAYSLFALAEREKNRLKYLFYMLLGGRIQHRGIGYHIKSMEYMKQYNNFLADELKISE